MNYAFATLFFIQFVMTMEMGSVFPIAPVLSDLFGIDASRIIMINIGFALFGLAAPVFGLAADRIGTKKAISAGLAFMTLGMGVTAFAQTGLHFLVGRSIIGIGFFSLSGLMAGYIGDLVSYEKRGRALSLVRFAFALAILWSPVYASFMVVRAGIKGLYLQYMTGALIALVLSTRLPNPNHHEALGGIQWEEIKGIPKLPAAKLFLLLQFVFAIPAIFVYGYLSIYLSESGASQSVIGWVYLIAGLGSAAGVLLAIWKSDRWGKVRFVKLSFLMMGIAILFVPQLSIAWGAVLLFFFATGMDGGWPVFQALASEVMRERRATFMTLMLFLVSLSNVLMYLIAPWVYETVGFGGISWIGFVAGLACFGLLTVIQRKYAEKF